MTLVAPLRRSWAKDLIHSGTYPVRIYGIADARPYGGNSSIAACGRKEIKIDIYNPADNNYITSHSVFIYMSKHDYGAKLRADILAAWDSGSGIDPDTFQWKELVGQECLMQMAVTGTWVNPVTTRKIPVPVPVPEPAPEPVPEQPWAEADYSSLIIARAKARTSDPICSYILSLTPEDIYSMISMWQSRELYNTSSKINALMEDDDDHPMADTTSSTATKPEITQEEILQFFHTGPALDDDNIWGDDVIVI